MIPSQDGADAQVGKVTIDLQFTADTAGGVPAMSTFAQSTGIVSVTKSTNDYIVRFDQSYLGFSNGYGDVIQASYAAGGALITKVKSVSIADATPDITLFFVDAAGTAVPLAVGDVLRYTFVLLTKPQPNALG